MSSVPETKPEAPVGPAFATSAACWLIRTAQNHISGPWSREEVRAKMLSGELQAQDEVCRANFYWIFLHERDEVLSQLGVEIPKPAGEEATQTETGSGKTSEDYDVHFAHDSDGGTSMLPGTGSAGTTPGRPVAAAGAKAHSQVFVSSRMGSLRVVSPSVQVLGKIERSSYWRGIAWFLLTTALVLIYLVLRALRTGTMKAPF